MSPGTEKANKESIPSGGRPPVVLSVSSIGDHLGLICVHLWLKGFSRTPTLMRLTALP
ncbi:hypothetical protein IAD21_05248 [Abditibacteriota bacterium]|nr:hypothetical protein IAD21_05248 [Abditibacteriota bacterium]